jgi:general secretion pathway protein J
MTHRHPGESRDLMRHETPAFAGVTKQESGFTLIELMISLGLFALIAVAGLAMVQGIINVQGRTEIRLDRLAELQRTVFVVTSDIDQIATGRVSGNPREGLKFTRAAPGMGGARIEIQYLVAGGMLVRKGGPAVQRLLPGVTAARWRFWDGEWRDRWPMTAEAADIWPRAIEMELQIVSPKGGPAGTIRRVIVLPVQLPPEPTPAAL